MIVILGASCSGKTTLYQNLKNLQNQNYIVSKEYTNRPKRINEDTYNFITTKQYNEYERESLFAASFKVAVTDGLWRYGILKSDTQKNSLIVTNPTNFRQLREFVTKDICSIYLKVPQNTRLIRMLNRGDELSESYRRVIHDDGHFSGIDTMVNYVIDSLDSDEVCAQAIQYINAYL